MNDYKRLTEKDIPSETKKKLCMVLCDIKRRCLNPNYKYFYLYGERGIDVCEEWLGKDGQKNFREWAVNNGYQKGLTIDRIDNNKGYSPNNCRWVTAKQQSYNRRSNKLITIQGKTQTVTEWAKELGISVGALQNRLRYGWSEERLIEPKQVHLKMTKHEMRTEILELRKQVQEFQDKIENGTLIELPYLHHHKEDINGLNCEFWQVVFHYKGVMLTTKVIYDKAEAEAELAKIRGQK